ncbi:MAG: FHA domain-containing protein [Gammaproteobacteria bacterium]
MKTVKQFFKDLHRRRVLSSVLAYIALSWLVIQVADVVVDAFDFPDLALRITFFSLIVGFPFVLILAWFFDITLEGIVRTKEITRFELLDSAGEIVKGFDNEFLVGRSGRVEVDGEAVKVGLVIDDPMISRAHARLTPEGDGVLLIDLESSNGTFINDQKVEGEVFAYHNDRLRFDTVEYKLIDHEAPERVKRDSDDAGTFMRTAGTHVRPTSTLIRPLDSAASESTKPGND